MVDYDSEIKKYADDRNMAVSDVHILTFNLTFALFCKDCERCILITLYPDIQWNSYNYRSDDNLRYIHIVMCDDCITLISNGNEWKIDKTTICKSDVYSFIVSHAKGQFVDSNNIPILKIGAALRSDSVYMHVLGIKSKLQFNSHVMREILEDDDITIVDSNADGFF